MRGAANAPGRPERQPGLPELAELPFGAVMTALVALTLAGAVLALTCGSFPVSAQDALAAVWAHLAGEAPADRTIASIVVNVRLPRIILAIAAGAGLAAAGAGFQAIFSNPLATPDTLGVATGAAFGAVLGILLGLGPAAVQAASLAAGLAAVALVFFVSRLRGRTSVLMLILSGLVIAALFSALISLVKYVADPQDVLPSITFWMMGSFTGATLPALLAGLPFIVAGAAALWLLRWRMNVLSLPEDEARSLGVPVGLLRTAVIVASTMMTASVVSMCGLIGWVGLLIPHCARLLFGANNDRVIPASLVIGALFVLAADTVARSAGEMEIPVSILTAVIGAPLFIVLLRRTGVVNS